METQVVRTHISTFGKAPARYGRRAVKVGPESCAALVRAGWEYQGHGRYCAYVIPPAGVSAHDPLVEVQVPTDAEILSIARRMHTVGKSCVEEIDGWVVWYRATGSSVAQIVATFEFYQEGGVGVTGPEEPLRLEAAECRFGVGSPWEVLVHWDSSDNEPQIQRRAPRQEQTVPAPGDE